MRIISAITVTSMHHSHCARAMGSLYSVVTPVLHAGTFGASVRDGIVAGSASHSHLNVNHR